MRRTFGLVRIWSSPPGAPLVRRPTDVLLSVGSLAGLLLISLIAPGPTAVDEALSDLMTAIEPITSWLWQIGWAVLVLWSVVLLALGLARGRRRAFVEMVVAAALAVGVGILLSTWAGTSVDTSLSAIVGSLGEGPVYLAVRVAMATAVIVVASPLLSRPLRLVGRVVVAFGAIAAVGVTATTPMGVIAGILVGVLAASLVHLAVGTPPGVLSPDDVEQACADLDVAVQDVRLADDQLAGVSRFVGVDSSGTPLAIRVYGRDSWDTQVVGSLWRTLTMRGESIRLGGTRMARVERLALASLLAERAGVPVAPVLAVGRAGLGDAVLVQRGRGEGGADRAAFASWWGALRTLHAAGMSHGDLTRRALVILPEGTPVLAEFSSPFSNADPGDQAADSARLLVTSALALGADEAVAVAVETIGAEALVSALPYLQPAVLDPATRGEVRAAGSLLVDLRTASAAACGVDLPALEQVRRVTGRSIGMVAVIALMAYVLVSALSGVDPQEVVSAMADADWAWILAGLLLSPVVQMSYAVGTMGATLVRLRYVAVLMLQYAIQFIALVLPATAARIALEVRFFQNFGLKPGAAMSVGVIDSFLGFLVQIVLIVTILVSGLPGFTDSLRSTDSSSTSSESTSSSLSPMMLVLVLIVGGLLVSALVPSLRHRVYGQVPRLIAAVREQMTAARSSLDVLRKPGKIAQMLGGNLGAQVLQAIILGLCLAAFGQEASLSQLILINTAVSLFAGLMPVPGGMGVAEAGYTAGLTAIGVPSAIAVSTAIAFRLVTFYLPPLWGAVAMRWLRRHEYV